MSSWNLVGKVQFKAVVQCTSTVCACTKYRVESQKIWSPRCDYCGQKFHRPVLTRKFPFSVKCSYKLCKIVRSTFIFNISSRRVRFFCFFRWKLKKVRTTKMQIFRNNCSNLAMNGESRAATLCPPLNCESSYRTISRDIISGFAVYSPSILANFQCPL